jgi:phosphotransferase system enzyme I (PtsI)
MKIELNATLRPERILTGLPVSPGIATGTAWMSEGNQLQTPVYTLARDRVEAELARFAEAQAAAIRQLKKLRSKAAALPPNAAEEVSSLLDARIQMLGDSRLVRGVRQRIADHLVNAEAAISDEIAILVEGFGRMHDEYLSARADDVREIGDRLIRHLLRAPYEAFKHLPAGTILIAEDLSPADTMLLDPSRIAGIAGMLGGMDSHTAIVARSLGIPAVLGVSGLFDGVEAGDSVVIDGSAGRVVVNPQAETERDYAQASATLAQDRVKLATLRYLPAVTTDGVEISLHGNLERPRDVTAVYETGAAGIGLLRTEFLFMNRLTMPSEDEQYETLRDVVLGMSGRPVTVRTIDIGGDKLAPALREHLGEPDSCPNPALGVRGVRLSLTYIKQLEMQLAAILRAAWHGPVRILLPLITTVEEVVSVRNAAQRVLRRLTRRGADVPDTLPPIGVMIEVPGAALTADALAMVSDFFSIGTNDLTMYTLAIDRDEDRLAKLYNPLHPAVLRLIQFTIEAGLRSNLPVAICGEIAGDPRYTALLLGLGVRELSMTAGSLPRVKQRIRSLDMGVVTNQAKTIMEQRDPARISILLDALNHD